MERVTVVVGYPAIVVLGELSGDVVDADRVHVFLDVDDRADVKRPIKRSS